MPEWARLVVVLVADAGGSRGLLATPRARLDELDAAILEGLAQRLQVCLEIADIKARHGIPMMQPTRVDEVLARARRTAAEHSVDPDFVVGVYQRIIEETCAAEDRRIASMEEGAR